MNKDIVLFGIQWSGKWTQADLLLKKLSKYQYFEPWNILRALKSNDNVLWEHIRDRMNSGKMVDDAIMFWLFDIYMHLLEDGQYMMIDWFLRTENQLHYFLNQIYINKRDFVWVYFDLPRHVSIERLLARAKKEWRVDDNMKSIETRLDIYERETVPVIKYLENKWKLIVVDANKNIEDCFDELIKKLSEKWLV